MVELQLQDIQAIRRVALAAEESSRFERKIKNLHHLIGTVSVPGVYSSRSCTRPVTPNGLFISDEALKTSQAIKERVRSATSKLRTPFIIQAGKRVANTNTRPSSSLPTSVRVRPLSAPAPKQRPKSAFASTIAANV